jgi:hypothetical protein
MLEDSLGGLDDRVSAADDGKCDTLFVIDTGQIPGRINQGFNLPIPVGPNGEWILFSVSFPVLPPRAPYPPCVASSSSAARRRRRLWPRPSTRWT